MAVPTYTSADPVIGPTAGRTLVQIVGTGFQTQAVAPPPPTGGPVPPPPPSVEVLFGTEPALEVQVVDDELLRVLTPIHDPGSVDITIRNIDAAGVAIPGEEVVAIGAYTFARPKLTAEFPSDLQRVVRAMIRELKRQVIANVNLTVHTDYDDETGASLALAKIAKMPALILVGPDLSENRFFSLNEPVDFDEQNLVDNEHDFVTTRAPYTVDLTFTIAGVSDRTTELLNLMAATAMFFESNKFLIMDRDPSDPAKGRVRYELDLADGGDMRVTGDTNNSNVRTFVGSFVIRGFDLEQLAGIESGSIGDVPKHEITDLGFEADDGPTVSTEPLP